MESLLAVVESYLEECLSAHAVPQVQDISQRLGVSSWAFTRRFERLLGESPGAYFKQAQLQRAKSLLLDTDEPVRAVAAMCGFSCARSFHRTFRRATGLTPRAYRRGAIRPLAKERS
ncbi:MAG: helix-turn-helix transcriptional regulator [Thermoanaerobaculia bacterium]